MTSIVVGKDRISLIESERYVAGTKNVYLMKVSFSEDWEGLDKKLVFHTDCFGIAVDVLSCSEQLPMPSEIFRKPVNKLQVGAYGSKCGTTCLNTRWLSLGRVVKGTFDPKYECGCESHAKPSPETYKFLREMIERKADRLTHENGMLVLWSGQDPLSSFDTPIGLPNGGDKGQVLAKASSANGDYKWVSMNGGHSLRVPLGTIVAWSGQIDDIPEGYSLCNGQNGTIDLRNAFIMGASRKIRPGTIIDSDFHNRIVPVKPRPQEHDANAHIPHDKPSDHDPRNSHHHGTHRPLQDPMKYHYYALAFIQKTSLTELDKKQGLSAYDIAVDNGFKGTESEWLASLQGPEGSEGEPGPQGPVGKSAYEIALENGFDGTVEDWLDAIAAGSSLAKIENKIIDTKELAPDKTGDYFFDDVTLQIYNAKTRAASVYFESNVVHVDLTENGKITFTTLSNVNYVATLNEAGEITEITTVTSNSEGDSTVEGPKGDKGDDGKSAYDIAVENGFVGDEKAWLESLKGEKGEDGKDGQPGIQGDRGEDGKSAFEIAKEKNPDLTDEEQWLESLKGEKGDDGKDGQPGENGVAGKSAYEIAKEHNPSLESEEQWLESLKGEKGDRGDPGQAGENGQNGSDGAPGESAYEIAKRLGLTNADTEEEWLASLQGEPGEDGRSVQKIEEYSTDSEIIVGRWIDGKPVKRKVYQLKDITVSLSGMKDLVQIEQGLTIVRLEAIAEFQDGDGIRIAADGKFTVQLPAMYNRDWFAIRYYPEETGNNLFLYTDGTISKSVELDLTLIVEYVNPADGELTDDDLIVDDELGSGNTGTSDHRKLINRDAVQQHPISAITNLTNDLAIRPSKSIGNGEIDNLFK